MPAIAFEGPPSALHDTDSTAILSDDVPDMVGVVVLSAALLEGEDIDSVGVLVFTVIVIDLEVVNPSEFVAVTEIT
ncbi:MAG: hypothetical protein ACREBI_04315 [Nitrosotalea sp.]